MIQKRSMILVSDQASISKWWWTGAISSTRRRNNLNAMTWTATGTHQGELMGIAPTGRSVTVTGMGVDRISGGQIVESWANYDALGMLAQLGAIPAPSSA